MTEYASFEELTAGVAVSEDVSLTGGGKVLVRGLSRYEYMLASKVMADGSADVAGFEVKVTFFGLLEPKLSEAQVAAWQKSPGAFSDFQAVHEAVMRLSGLREGADKSDLPEHGLEP